ncbi:MAG TPA: DUF2460 domain-containing protein [Bryobacteraceae bacterium]|nr:DUF2460 domain-containing protein [Bryobacteraceae bacterium]
MLYYPQLATGSLSQFPVDRTMQLRTITNQMLGGDNIRASDTGAGAVRWQLQYQGLTDAEWESIDQLFEAVEGKLGTFTFLDPTDNLLLWSEEWAQKAWSPDPLIAMGTGVQDPFGDSNAMQITNNAQTTQRVMQATAGPSWFQYCFSVFLRSDAPCVVQLVVSTTGQDWTSPVNVGPNWTRMAAGTSLSEIQDGVSFGIQLPAGFRIYAFGAQAEAQRGAGPYKKTTDLAGVYSNARFDSDSLSRTTNAPNQNSTVVRLMSSLS